MFKQNIYKFVNLKENWAFVFILIIFTIVEGLVPSVSSLLIGRCFKIFTNISQGQYHSYADMHHDLVLKTMSLVILAFGYFPISWITVTLWMRFGEIQNYKIRSAIFNAYLKKDFTFFDNHKDLLAEFIQINRCTEEVRQSCSEASGMAFQSGVSILSLLGVSCYFSWSLTLIFLCTAPLIAIVASISSKKYKNFTDLENNESLKCSDQLLRVIENISLIKLNITENQELEKFNEKIKNCNTFYIKGSFWTSFNQAVLRILSLCMFVQGFWFGSTEIKKGKLTTEKVITCFTSCISLGSTLMSFIHQIIIIQKGEVALKYIDTMFDNKSTNYISSNIISQPLPQELCNSANFSITFSNVISSYATRPNVNVLQNVNLCFTERKTYFVVGKSGSGKSTIFSLLLKMYDNQYNGIIAINKINIREIPTTWLLSKITLVEQHTNLFNDTIKANIIIGSNFTDGDNDILLNEILEITDLKKDIELLPNGLDTIIGESKFSELDLDDDSTINNNVVLSGGQEQKVAIARALLRNAPVIIFDESFSAIDIKSRKFIIEKVKKFRKSKTTIILTHDLTSISDKDLVCVIESGRVSEMGTKSDLLKLNSLFKKMFTLQTFYQREQIESDQCCKRFDEDKQLFEVTSLDSHDGISVFNSSTNDYSLKTAIQVKKFFNNDKKFIYMKDEIKELSIDTIQYEYCQTAKRLPITPLKLIFKSMFHTINKKKILFLGLFSSILSGVLNPVFSWADAKLINANVLQKTSQNKTALIVNNIVEYVKIKNLVHFNNKTTLSEVRSNEATTPTTTYVVKWCLVVIAIAVLDGIATLLKNFLLQYVAEYWIMNLRYSCFKIILSNQLTWFSFALNRPSEIAAILMNDLRDMRILVSQFMVVVVSIISVTLCGLIWALCSGWKLSLVGLSMVPLYIMTTIIYSSLLQTLENTYKSSVANLENKQYEILKNFKTIKILQVDNHFTLQLGECYKNMKAVGLKRTYNTGIGVAIFSSLTYIVQAIIIFYGLELVIKGEYTSEKLFTTFSLLLFTIISCALLSSALPDLARGQRCATYVFQIINNKMPEIQASNAYVPKFTDSFNDEIIEFDKVSFVYPNNTTKIFKELSFKVNKGESIALVGPSGCGKSTILKLISKLQDSSNGIIKINNFNISEWDITALRQYIVFLEQKSLSFKGTLRENLSYGNTATDKEIITLIFRFQLNDLYNELGGLDHGLIDSGLISGGQLQRINLVRQFLRLKSLKEKCQIAVFDEITSSLDPEISLIVENYVFQEVSQTKLLITHHMSIMKKCDKLLVFDQFGVLKEFDSFSKLTKIPNSYLNKLICDFD
ncbi:hypothetical protein QEN19_001359 [Hanseniaspora menglaensis]